MESEFFGKSVAAMALEAVKKLDEECEPKGAVFSSNAVMCAKEAWRKWLEEQDRLRDSIVGVSPWLQKLMRKTEREDGELEKAMLESPLLGYREVWRSGFDVGYEKAPLKKCECGVAITGGLHSDWCPLHE